AQATRARVNAAESSIAGAAEHWRSQLDQRKRAVRKRSRAAGRTAICDWRRGLRPGLARDDPQARHARRQLLKGKTDAQLPKAQARGARPAPGPATATRQPARFHGLARGPPRPDGAKAPAQSAAPAQPARRAPIANWSDTNSQSPGPAASGPATPGA